MCDIDLAFSVNAKRDLRQPPNFIAWEVALGDAEIRKCSSGHSSSLACHGIVINVQLDHRIVYLYPSNEGIPHGGSLQYKFQI